MIELTEAIRKDDFLKIPVPFKSGKVRIEVASNRPIDVAVLDPDEYKAFSKEADAEDDQEWHENMRQAEFDFEIPDPNKKYSLVLWNCNSDGKALAAYKLSLL
jgi:hypothetical protein